MREYNNKLSFEQKLCLFFGFGFLMSVYTYGHAYKHYDCDTHYSCNMKGMDCFISAIAWPYYWSKELQK